MGKDNFNYQLYIRRFGLVLMDSVCVVVSSVMALITRFEFQADQVPKEFTSVLVQNELFFIILSLAAFWLFKIYSSLWEYAGLNEVVNVFVACIVIGLFEVAYIVAIGGYMPRSFYILNCLYLFFLVAGIRVCYRIIRTKLHGRPVPWGEREKVMIVGAGAAGRTLVEEIQNSRYLNQKICCIIDDDRRKIGSYIRGIPIVGDRNSIPKYVKRYGIKRIIIAIPSASGEQIRGILNICKETDCEMRMIPGVYQLVNGEVSVSRLRTVSVEDLLGRDEIKVNLEEILGYVQNRVIMVTGGGGSIGSEICRQIASHKPKQLIIFEIYENNAYDIQQELLRDYPDLNLAVLIGSVRDEKRLDVVFEKYKPEIVYHAAAHKHVPLMEDSPNEAIKNNVLGTYNMVRMADKWKTKKFVLISTDKAVNPTNIMGASKRICEMIIQTFNKHSDTDYVAVRFGNVLGSNGSVVPLFKKQIEAGGPVTVTHPDITRYFMTIPEAVSLVLQAGVYAKGGEIFVLDMGEPVKILDLAKNMIRLSGYVPDKDISIEFTGLRPGEKLYEELLMDEEGMTDTPNKLIHVGHPIDVNEDKLSYALYVLEQAAENEVEDMRLIVESIVPTYHVKQE